MTPQHAPQRLKQYFNMQWSVDDGKGTVSQRGRQPSGIFASTSLAWPNDDGWRGRVKPAEQLQNARPPGDCCSACSGQRDFKIYDRDVHGLVLDHRGSLFARVRMQRADAHGLEQPG
jgi:hypothetical protein